MDADFLLLHRMRNGDDQAIEEFVRKYYPMILRYCQLHIQDLGYAEDLTQETFARFFRTLSQYQHYGKAANYSAENTEANCEQLQSVNVGDLLQFVPEPENDYDPLAIRVVSQDGAHLGYIPRYYNKEILARLNKGMTYFCEVIEIDYDCSTSECIKVHVKMPCDE